MQIIEFDKNSIFTDQDLKQFFRENDFLFPDPFANHIELDTYMDKLIRYGVILIAEEDQKILGISCSYMNDYRNMIAHCQMLLVSKDVHGRGIGRKLTMSTIERARINGFDSIEITVDKVNTKAEKLYRSAGYIDSELTHSNPEKKYMVHYFNKEKLTLRETQNRLLEMGKTIHNILERNQIPYMIAFGTLLGAVRHKGFIPWDDDFDLFLFGDSYDRAIAVLRKELPDDMFLEDSESEPKYFHSWAHVKDCKTFARCEQFPQDNTYSHHGISIDLYNIYAMDEAEIDQFRLEENLKYYKRRYTIGMMEETEFCQRQCDIEERAALLSIQKKAERPRPAYGMVLNERVLYPEEIFPLRRYSFEDTEFYGPSNPDSILTRAYGEYMTLPPEQNRVPHYSIVKRI